MFVLASTSPRRRELITLFGLPFEFISVDVDETPHENESPEDLVKRLSVSKSSEGARAHSGTIVVAADTVVAFDNQILGKPKDADDAVRMLELLRARAHYVYSGVTIIRGAEQRTQIARTTVWMRDYSDDEIKTFVASGEALDKAAAYSIQDPGFRPVARVEGCYANVMGLPLCHLYRALKSFGVSIIEPDRACQKHLDIYCPVAKQILADEYSIENLKSKI